MEMIVRYLGLSPVAYVWQGCIPKLKIQALSYIGGFSLYLGRVIYASEYTIWQNCS